MNDNNNNNNSAYRATRNLNTALESPEYKVDNAFDVNIKGATNNNYVIEEKNVNYSFENNITNDNKLDFSTTTSFINNNIMDNENNLNESIISNDSKVNYVPTTSGKKNKKPFRIPFELKLLIVIVILLLIFVFFMPVIYDFIKEIESIIFNR